MSANSSVPEAILEHLRGHIKSKISATTYFICIFASPSLDNAPPKPSWGDLMDAEDGGLENVEPSCFYNLWSTNTTTQVEEQKLEEQKVEE
ncbi:hypothetical protein AMELA_G00287240 [Ameiurus melas]|uniref:Uncharacterized protein n=1 Tax=Ameiurus melas TaxID=219545 RepID=A0A7J5ZLD4_AMEME|nr:hypothetical protein AMELA_G00287240 [Ameiurus melas]